MQKAIVFGALTAIVFMSVFSFIAVGKPNPSGVSGSAQIISPSGYPLPNDNGPAPKPRQELTSPNQIVMQSSDGGGCITTWECRDGEAVKKDWTPQQLIDNPSASGYTVVAGKYCYASEETKPTNCAPWLEESKKIISESEKPMSVPTTTLNENSVSPKKINLWERIKSWFKK